MLIEQPQGHVTTPITPARPLCFGSAARNFPMCDVCRYEDLCYATWESMYLWTDHESKSALLRVYAREAHDLRTENAALRERVEVLEWLREVEDYIPWSDHPMGTACGNSSRRGEIFADAAEEHGEMLAHARKEAGV